MKLTPFEQKLRDCLTETPPEPKYKLWQTVQYQVQAKNYETSQVTGEICGLCFNRAEVAWMEEFDFGWVYTVHSGGNQYRCLAEDAIVKAIEGVDNA
jgi:hypothetical protein